MTGPETPTNPEQYQINPRQVYDFVCSLDPTRNPIYVGLDQIQGTELAKVFMQGCVDSIQEDNRKYAASGETDKIISDPLESIMGSISYASGHLIDGKSPKSASEQVASIVRPWRNAYKQLADQA